MKRLALLSRDGVINEVRRPYVTCLEELVFLPGALEAIVRLNSLNFVVTVVSNQSCIDLGVVSGDVVEAINDHIKVQVVRLGGHISAFYICPHTPDYGCACRKPRAGLITRAYREFGLPMDSAIMVGDKETDRIAAAWADVGEFFMIGHGPGEYVSLDAVVDAIATL